MATIDLSKLFSPATVGDPYPLYAELRERAPVFKLEPSGLWVLSRYDDVHHVLKTPALFSSARPPAMKALRDERVQPDLESCIGASLVVSDPPVHTRLRKLINVAFTPRTITRLEGRIRDLARELVDNILEKREFDLMEELAVPLPMIVISEMLGVDTARRDDFKRWSGSLLLGSNFDEPLDDDEIAQVSQSRQEFIDYLRALIDARRIEPREDLISDLVRAEVSPEMLSPEEVLGMAISLMVAGNLTTTNLIGNATLEILDHPEYLARLRADASLIPGFLEEVLRYRSPVTLLTRTATEDVTIRGVTIPKGAIVVALIDSANRDPDHFPDPDRFDITRRPDGHLTFGYGIHFCVGAPLSRLEGRIAFEEIFRRLPAFSREPGPLVWTRSFSLRGLKTFPLRFDD